MMECTHATRPRPLAFQLTFAATCDTWYLVTPTSRQLGGHQLSWGAVMLCMYSFYYVNLEATGGLCFAALGTVRCLS